MRVVLTIEMQLLSDAIFSTGYSSSGGEAFSVCTDADGFPYLKASSLKGLLRESAENIAAWRKIDASYIDLLFGKKSWNSESEERKIQFTDMHLKNPPNRSEDCFCTRSFTGMCDGVSIVGSLRIAQCIHKGLCFRGEIVCDDGDADFIMLALKGVQHAGTMRNRGLGHVRLEHIKTSEEILPDKCVKSPCIRYRVRLDAPLQITSSEKNSEKSSQTRHYISGSAVRGMVMSRLSKNDPEWFASNKVKLLSDSLRFSDAFPLPDGRGADIPVIPSPLGFYESANETELENVLTTGTYSPNKKRAELSLFCNIEGNKIVYWDAHTEDVTRISRFENNSSTLFFQSEHLCTGQVFEGFIYIDDLALAPNVTQCLCGTAWLGADRYQGYGKCTIEHEKAEAPLYIDAYGIKDADTVPEEIYMLLISPAAIVGKTGTPCAMSDILLSELFETKTEIVHCATSVSSYKSYNRTWGCFSPAVKMYERGSMFKLHFLVPPSAQVVQKLQREGIGIRRSEGFGQVLFIPAQLIDSINEKAPYHNAVTDASLSEEIVLRRKKINWVVSQVKHLNFSKARRLVTLCEKAILKGGDLSEIRNFEENINNRNIVIREQYRAIFKTMNEILDATADLPVSDHESVVEKLELLKMLLYYQKIKGE